MLVDTVVVLVDEGDVVSVVLCVVLRDEVCEEVIVVIPDEVTDVVSVVEYEVVAVEVIVLSLCRICSYDCGDHGSSACD